MGPAGRRFSASLGTRGRGVGDDGQVGAGDAEHGAIELDVTDDIAAWHLSLRLMLVAGRVPAAGARCT
jgi:hypothetical protein